MATARVLLWTFGATLVAVAAVWFVTRTGDCPSPATWAVRDGAYLVDRDADGALERVLASRCRSHALAQLELVLLAGIPGVAMIAVASISAALEGARRRERQAGHAALAARRVDGGWWAWHGAHGWRFHPDPPQ